jgi:ubiquinone/menaquinone biosynthesis C-methylase UbiE
MLQRYLRPWALALDELNFRVVLRDSRDTNANRFFEEGESLSPRIDGAIRRALDLRIRATGLRPPAGARVLDVCSGRGHLGELLADRYEARVVFADLSMAQLSELSRRAGGAGAVTACASDLLHLPYQSNSFDLVVGHSFLHHVNDVPAAIAELARVTRPGGTVALLHEPNVNANFWESFPLSLLKDTSPVDGFTDLWMFTAADLERLFTGAGLADVSVRGTGVTSAVLLNWYLMLLAKLGAEGSAPAVAGYDLRSRLNARELASAGTRWNTRAPSLVVAARKPTGAATGGAK